MNLAWNWIGEANKLMEENISFAVVTISKAGGSTPRDVGAKMLVVDEKRFYGTIGGGALENDILNKTAELLRSGANGTHTISYSLKKDLQMNCGGDSDVLIEIISAAADLYIFGAGHVALALTHVLQGTPFSRIHVIDPREEWLNKFGKNIIKHKMNYRDFFKEECEKGKAFSQQKASTLYAIVMTPGHEFDQEMVELFMTLSYEVNYLGVIGSLTKWGALKKKLVEKSNGNISMERLDKINCPIGLKLGGKSPAEIGISISAELLAKLHNNIDQFCRWK